MLAAQSGGTACVCLTASRPSAGDEAMIAVEEKAQELLVEKAREAGESRAQAVQDAAALSVAEAAPDPSATDGALAMEAGPGGSAVVAPDGERGGSLSGSLWQHPACSPAASEPGATGTTVHGAGAPSIMP